jgi:uncharacterized protein with ATP-grasp and redox domains
MIKANTRCKECLYRLAETLNGLAREQSNLQPDDEPLKEISRIVESGIAHRLASPIIAKQMLTVTERIYGISDPYVSFKDDEIARAKDAFSRIDAGAGGDFRSLIELAVIGNSLDFFHEPELVLKEVPELVGNGISFYRDDIAELEKFLSGGQRTVLYLTDNAGEAFFDLPLYESIRARSKKCVLVVKGGPALNDLTREEIHEMGIKSRFHDVADTGTGGPGIDWETVSDEFLSLVHEADLIISKGMANFETIYSERLNASVLFLFRVKCEAISEITETPTGEFIALWQNGKKN